MDEPDLFSDFDLEEVKEVLGISNAKEPIFDTNKSDTSSDKGSKASSSKAEKEDKKNDEDEDKKEEPEEVDIRYMLCG